MEEGEEEEEEEEEGCFLVGCSGLGFLTVVLPLLLPVPPSGTDLGMAAAAAEASCLGVILVVEEGGDGKGEGRDVGGGLLGSGLLRGSRGETALRGRARWSYIAEPEGRERDAVYSYCYIVLCSGRDSLDSGE